MTVKASDLKYTSSFPIVSRKPSFTLTVDPSSGIDMLSPKWEAISRCLRQYDRLRTAYVDFGVIMLLPADWYPDWQGVYGIEVLHIEGLKQPILGYAPDADDRDPFSLR